MAHPYFSHCNWVTTSSSHSICWNLDVDWFLSGGFDLMAAVYWHRSDSLSSVISLRKTRTNGNENETFRPPLTFFLTWFGQLWRSKGWRRWISLSYSFPCWHSWQSSQSMSLYGCNWPVIGVNWTAARNLFVQTTLIEIEDVDILFQDEWWVSEVALQRINCVSTLKVWW